METKEITILGLAVPVSQPYAEGHVCTAAEARALNQTRAENIGNNLRKEFAAARNEDGSYSPEARQTLLEAISKRDAEYVFNMASAGGGRKTLDPIDKEARTIARAQISLKLKETGRTFKDVDKDVLDNKIAELMQNEQIRKLAAKRVKEAQNGADALAIEI